MKYAVAALLAINATAISIRNKINGMYCMPMNMYSGSMYSGSMYSMGMDMYSGSM